MIVSSKEYSKETLRILLEKFCINANFGILMTDSNIPIDFALRKEILSIMEYINQYTVYLYIQNTAIVGMIGFRRSDWDSIHFGYNVAKIDYFLYDQKHTHAQRAVQQLIKQYDDFVIKYDVKLCLSKVYSSSYLITEEFQKDDFSFYECITYRRRYLDTSIVTSSSKFGYRFAKKSDLQMLQNIAAENTFDKSHFYLDRNFKKLEIDYMYQKWVTTALNEANKNIIVVEIESQIAGMFIYSLGHKDVDRNLCSATLEFLAVSSNFRGKGLGSHLFESVLKACYDDGARIINSSLADKNIISQKIHEKFNFNLVNTSYTFHKWY